MLSFLFILGLIYRRTHSWTLFYFFEHNFISIRHVDKYKSNSLIDQKQLSMWSIKKLVDHLCAIGFLGSGNHKAYVSGWCHGTGSLLLSVYAAVKPNGKTKKQTNTQKKDFSAPDANKAFQLMAETVPNWVNVGYKLANRCNPRVAGAPPSFLYYTNDGVIGNRASILNFEIRVLLRQRLQVTALRGWHRSQVD